VNLDPTVSPWIGIFASTAVCIWMAAIGVPLSHAVFGDRPRQVWPFYAPAIGIVVVLLTTNLSAYVIPGAPSAWFGLLAPSALAAFLAWRGRRIQSLSHRNMLASLGLLLTSAGIYLLAFANRVQERAGEETWHFPLVLRMARGVVPPVTPYGQDAGIGYHYGPDLLAASIVNTAGTPPWTAVAVVTALLVVALLLAAVGFAWNIGAPLPLAIGAGAVLALVAQPLHVGLPPYVVSPGEASGFAAFLAGFASNGPAVAFEWVRKPHWALAVCIVLLVAAGLESATGRRQAAFIATTAGVLALGEAAVLVFASLALGGVVAIRLIHLDGRNRLLLAGAVTGAALFAALAGGPVSDALFQRGGEEGMARIAFEPDWQRLVPFELSRPALVRIGIVPLIAIGAVCAYWRRSWGLFYLTAASALGLVEAIVLQSPLPGNDARILFLAAAIASFAALTGVAALTGGLHGWQRNAAIVAVLILGVLPTVVPRATTGVRLAVRGFAVEQPIVQGPGFPYVGQSQFAAELDQNWDFYAWLARALPNDARLLTTRPAVVASVAGIAAPTSGRRVQVLSSSSMPVYDDALRFLDHEDLAEMGITHLHLTDAWANVLRPEARRLLDDPTQMQLLVDMHSVSGERHRVFKVLPGAGTRELAAGSFRLLREIAPLDGPMIQLEGIADHQSRMLLSNFVARDDLRASETFFNQRAVRLPRVSPLEDIPDLGAIALLDHVEPTALGLSRDDAIWSGYGMRVYDLASAWSPVWRVGSDFAELPVPSRLACESSDDGRLELRLLGEPGSAVTAGQIDSEISGISQVTSLTVRDCSKLAVAAHADVAPFAQLRPEYAAPAESMQRQVAGLGFDGGNDGDLAIVNLWYRNPQGLPITSGSEFRLYQAGPSGVVPRETDPRESVGWWSAPLTLALDSQQARIEFDPQRLTINGDPGVRSSGLAPGRTYLLALNVSRFSPETTSLWIQQVIPLVRIEVHESGTSAEVFSGIVSIEHREIGGPSRWFDYTGIIGWEIDLTPWPEAPEHST
jgi:hypothetical protein